MYQDLADIYQNYIHDRLEITNNKKDKITYKILYEDFKDWFQLTRNTRTTIKFGEFKIELLQKLPDDVTDTMKGIKLRPADVKPKPEIENFVDDNEEDEKKNEENGHESYA
jgi:hypothetical protein